MKLGNEIYVWVLSGLIPLLHKREKNKIIKKYICLYHVMLNHLPAIVSVLDFEGYISVHHLRLALTVSHI